jgi:hypothetical protein
MKRILFLLFSLIAITSQAQVSLGGYIQPLNNSSYPVQIDSLGKGGYMVARDTTERNNISCLRRKYGMAVYSQAQQKLYILKDSNCVNTWVEFTSGGGNAYTTTTQINDTSYFITRSDGTKDTFLFTGGGSASGQYIDSLKRSRDSVYGRINNVFRFQYKDSIGGAGGVTSVGSGYGIANSPTTIIATGSVIVDTSVSGLSGKYLRIADTTTMLTPYLRKIDTASLSNRINLKLSISDTSTMLNPYLRKIDSSRWVSSITRTPGKDSIIFFKNGDRFAIKDSVGTNPPASGYYGAFQDNTSQTAASINTAYAVKLNTTDLTNGVSVVNDGSGNPTKIRLANTGIYNIQFSLQLEKTGGSGNMIADIWIRKNSVDIPSTTGKVVLTGSANASPTIAAWNYVLDLAAGDSIQLMWATSNTNVEIIAAAASSPHPAIPSAILTVTQQAGILAGTGITAINSLTGAAQTMVVDSSNSTFKITSTGTSHTFNIPNASTSGVTRGLLSNTQYTTFNNKIGTGDTAAMLTPYLRKVDTTAMLLPYLRKVDTTAMLLPYLRKVDTTAMLLPYLRKVDTTAMLLPYLRKVDTTAMLIPYLRKVDTTAMLTPYLRKTDTASLSSRINLKLAISDTSAMLSKYLRKTDTASLSSRIDAKLAITDTSVFQRKSLASYTFMANNTTATANATANTFRDSAQKAYTGTITWTGTGPTGATNHSYHWSQIGKLVTLRINLVYASAGTATAVNITLPSDCPTPELPTGLSGADRILGFCTGFLVTSTNSNPTTAGATVSNFKINSANNGYEFYLVRASALIIAA